VISENALNHEASDRIVQLAKRTTDHDNSHLFFKPLTAEGPIRRVPPGARSTTPSERIVELARAKSYKEGYVGNSTPFWPISKAARRANASTRVSELSTPISRKEADTLNPEAFTVNQNAIKFPYTSERISELSQPIKR